MADQILQQVVVEFTASIAKEFEKALNKAMQGFVALSAAQKNAADTFANTGAAQEKLARSSRSLSTETEKAADTQSKFSKIMQSLKDDYGAAGAGLSSVESAMKYFALGVTKGNASLDVAQKKTRDYISALTSTNSVLMSANESWGSWAKGVSFNSLKLAENQGHIAITRSGIKLLNTDIAKSIGLNGEQVATLRNAGMVYDLYAQKLKDGATHGVKYQEAIRKLGGEYGTTTERVAYWSTALENSRKAVGSFGVSLGNLNKDFKGVADNLDLVTVASQVMKGNLGASASGFKVFNEEGLKALDISEGAAIQMKMLGSSYNEYGKTLQKLTHNQKQSLGAFHQLTQDYGKHDAVVKDIGKSLTAVDGIISSRIITNWARLQGEVKQQSIGMKEARAEQREFIASLDRTAMANNHFLETQRKATGGNIEFTKEMAAARLKSEEYQKAFYELSRTTADMPSKWQSAKNALDTVERAIVNTSRAMTKAGGDGEAWAKSQDRIKLSNQLMAGELQIVNGLMTGWEQNMVASTAKANLFSGALNKLVMSFKSMASYAISAFAFFGVLGVIKSIVTEITSFDQSLKDLQAITTATDYQTQQFGETIKKVASETRFSAQEVAEGMKYFGQAGLEANEVIAIIGDAATLATGTLSDFNTVADLLSTTIRAFQLEASEGARLTDIFANAINRSKLDVDKLRVAFNYFAPVAHKANLTVEDSVTMMGLLANSGVRASTIGTGLRQVLEKMNNPTDKFRKAIERAGFTLEDFVVTAANPLENVIRRLSKVIPDAQTSFELFGMRGSSAVSALTASGVSGFMDMKASIVESGSALKMAELQMTGLGNRAKNMQSKLGLLSIALGEAGLKYVLSGLIDAVRWLADLLGGALNSVIGATIVSVGALSAVMLGVQVLTKWFLASKLATTFLGIGTSAATSTIAVNTFTFSLTRLQTVLTFLHSFLLSSPFGWAILATGVFLATGAMVNFVNETKDFNSILEEKKAKLDQEIIAVERQKQAMEGLLYIAKDTTKSDIERTRAINRLSSLGIEFNGVLRDQDGIITNLNEVLNKNNDLLNDKFAIINAFVEGRQLQTFHDTLVALTEAEERRFQLHSMFHKQGIDPYSESPNLFESVGQVPLASAMGFSWIMNKYREIRKKEYREIVEDVDQFENEIKNIMRFHQGKTEDEMKAYLSTIFRDKQQLNAVMEEWKKGVDLDFILKMYEMWAVSKNIDTESIEHLNRIEKVTNSYKQRHESLEDLLKEINIKTGTITNKIYDNFPDFDDVLTEKNVELYLNGLRKMSEEFVEELNTVYKDSIAYIESLPDSVSREIKDHWINVVNKEWAAATDNLMKETYNKREKGLRGLFELMDLETERQKLENEKQILLLKAKLETEVGMQAYYQAQIDAIKIESENLDAANNEKKQALFKTYLSKNIAGLKQLENQYASIQNKILDLLMPKSKTGKTKKTVDDKARREEELRAHAHAIRLAEISLEFYNKDIELAQATLDAKKAFNEQELEIVTNLYNIRKAQGEDTKDQERSLQRLALETLRLRKEELDFLEKQKKLKEANEKESREIAFKNAQLELRDIKNVNQRKIAEEKLRFKIELSHLKDKHHQKQISEENFIAEQERLYKEHYKNMEDLEDDWRKSATKAMEEYMYSSETYAEGFQKTFGNAIKGLEDTFVEFARTGKLSFRDMVNNMLDDLARLSTNQIFKSIFGYLLGDPVTGGITSGSSGGGLFGTLLKWLTGGGGLTEAASKLLKSDASIGGGAVALASGMATGGPVASLAAAEALSKATGTLSETTSAIANESGGFFSGIWDSVKGFFSSFTDLFNGEGGFFSGLWEKIKGLFSGFFGLFTGEGGFIGNFFGNIWEKITGLFGGLTGGFGGMFETLKGGMTGFFGGFGSTIAGWFGSLAQGFTGFFGTIWSWIQGLFAGGLGGIGSSIGGGLMTLFRPVLGLLGMADGGPVPGYSPHSRADNIPIMATAGEFMHPVPTVDYYGRGVMEAIRTRSIPKDILSSFAKNPHQRSGNRFADGGYVDNFDNSQENLRDEKSLQIVNILDPGMFDQYVSSQAGQKAILNVISRNPAIIKNMMR